MYLGVRLLDGPFHSDVLQFAYSLRMSPKWISEFSTGYDFLNHQNIGQHGAEPATFHGLAGVGDLITTCFSPHGRNRRVGYRLGKGEPLSAV